MTERDRSGSDQEAFNEAQHLYLVECAKAAQSEWMVAVERRRAAERDEAQAMARFKAFQDAAEQARTAISRASTR